MTDEEIKKSGAWGIFTDEVDGWIDHFNEGKVNCPADIVDDLTVIVNHLQILKEKAREKGLLFYNRDCDSAPWAGADDDGYFN